MLKVAPSTTDPASPWTFVYPLLLVLFGLGGMVALIFAVIAIVSGNRRPFGARLTKWLAAGAMLAVFVFNWPWIPTFLAGEVTFDAVWPLLLYLVLPVGSSIHLLWLFSRKPASTNRDSESE